MLLASSPSAVDPIAIAWQSFCRQLSDAAVLPFDLARSQYAQAVRLGLVPNSQLASARVEQQLDLLERLTLGPLARQV